MLFHCDYAETTIINYYYYYYYYYMTLYDYRGSYMTLYEIKESYMMGNPGRGEDKGEKILFLLSTLAQIHAP